MTPEVLVFSHSVSSRLQYIIDFLSLYYGLPFKLIFDEERYVNSIAPVKINYSYHRVQPGEIFIHSHVLLFETTVRQVKIDCFVQKHYKAFFKTEGESGFDLFAGIFYLLTRYEEYLPHQKDNYGRYAHQNSTAFKEGFLNLPLINIWLEDFRQILIEKDENFRHNINRFTFLPTYDIDMAWVYRNKGFKRNAGAILLLLLKLRFAKAVHRYRVIKRKTQDPYDAYSWMDELHQSTATRPVYFFLMAKQQSRYDRNIDIDNSEFIHLVKDISSKYTVGLHPSWQSGDDHSLIKNEKTDLEKITGQIVQDSRQHFIRFDLPSSFRQLISAGLVNDYSMGYGSINGFRASISGSFYWYDLKNETSTGLMIHPFCFMDANAYYEQGLSAEKAYEELMHYYHEIRSVQGCMITIWHNSFLGNSDVFNGWRQVYEKFVKFISVSE